MLPSADKLAGNILGTYLLNDMMTHVKAPLQELASADLVVLEVPPITEQKFECDLLNLIYKIRNLGPEILVIVQPSLRSKSNKSIGCIVGTRCHMYHSSLRRLVRAKPDVQFQAVTSLA